MKKSLRKVIVTLAAVTALSAAMAATASAASVTMEETTVGNPVVSGEKEITTITSKVKAAAGEEVTMLVVKPGADTSDGVQENEIAYIDQKTADASTGEVTFTMPIDTTDKTVYKAGATLTLMSGSTTADAAASDDATIGGGATAVHYGDPSGDKAIDTTDAIMVLDAFVGNITLTEEQTACADVNKDNAVDTSDAIYILDYFVGTRGNIDDSWMTITE